MQRLGRNTIYCLIFAVIGLMSILEKCRSIRQDVDPIRNILFFLLQLKTTLWVIYITNENSFRRCVMADAFVSRSLDEIRFWSRIMKEHSLFLRLGFRCEDTQLINEANHFYNHFEQIEINPILIHKILIRRPYANLTWMYIMQRFTSGRSNEKSLD